jgi:uncharacterized iron-regulated protein
MRSAVARLLPFLLAALPAMAAEPPGGWQSRLAADHPLVGRIWSAAAQDYVDTNVLRQSLSGARYVLLGETHDNPDHHRLQAWAIQAMVDAGRRPAVVWEMLTADQAPALAAYLARPDDGAAGLGAAVGWPASGWPDWSIYQPIAAVALAAGLPMAAGNVGEGLKRAVLRDGLAALPVERRAALGLIDWREEHRQALLDDLYESHCALMPRTQLAPLVAVQRLRDAVLADALLRADAGDGAALIAGAGHVRRDRGVPWYLAARGHRDVIVLTMREVRDGRVDPATYADGADVVWFTPRSDDRDHCAELRERIEKHKD